MFQTIDQQRVSSQQRLSNQLLLAVAAALLAVSVYVAIQRAATNVPSFQTQIQAPASGPAIDYDSTHIREFRAGRQF